MSDKTLVAPSGELGSSRELGGELSRRINADPEGVELSGELMDRVEILLDLEHVDEYVDLLFEKVEENRYPSKQLLDRIARWTLAAS